LTTGLRGVPLREAFPAAVYVPEEESQEEDDGVHEFVYGRQVLPRAAQLHRPASHVYPCESFHNNPCESFDNNPCESFDNNPCESFDNNPCESFDNNPCESFDNNPCESFDNNT